MRASPQHEKFVALKKQFIGTFKSLEKARSELATSLERADVAERSQRDMLRELKLLRERIARIEAAAKSLGVILPD